MNYLLRSEANYADEFDIEGLLEITLEQRDSLIENNMRLPGDDGSEDDDSGYADWDEGDVQFGTNEAVCYCDIDLSIVEVTGEELLILKRIYGIRPDQKLNVGTLDLDGHL